MNTGLSVVNKSSEFTSLFLPSLSSFCDILHCLKPILD